MKEANHIIALVTLLLMSLFLSACGSEEIGDVCDPNATQLCYCSASVQGVQTCQSNGNGWTTCDCGEGDVVSSDTANVVDAQDTTSAVDSGQICEPQSYESCICNTGADGTKQCNWEGTGYGPCTCGGAVPDGSSSLVCTPGATQVCSCNGVNGLQTCNAWGTAWGECLCDLEDAGSNTDVNPGPDVASDQGSPTDPNGVCNARTKVIWMLTKSTQLVYFDPATDTIQSVGTLNCNAGATATTFSMAVDQYATAYVQYVDGLGGFLGGGPKLYAANTLDASCTSLGNTSGAAGFESFGMAFVQDGSAETETLYASGTTLLDQLLPTSTAKLGSVDTGSLTIAQLGQFDTGGLPELTGTGDGSLWGFFATASPPTVRLIDKTSGQTSTTYTASQISLDATMGSYAFATWGGDFYLFVHSPPASSSTIWKLETDDGSVSEYMSNIGHTVVGAGVSTCAPTAD